ncbi:helix-turn-helix domain-containing protein [Oscillatoria sp. FACHB-1407]|uniref:helix-turn-helix transcriptional regulator n=1 Tax=Oscillatoria sp. FACHB-1407 TaxID=2692847 RepID=UPI001689137E|nr:helix-turn-helix transcriptional regulator [Oscillatoria sp. FACHB-1407]MBD2463623.1 helix-turn-helix domain-containing protein [Oscillatoria sp. FACHB-1407]
MKNRLKELRQLRQWSQSDLARALGVSRQAVNGFESGKFDPSLDMAFKIASLFQVAIEDVFIFEAKNSMQTLLERVKNFFGFEFGFERFTEQAIHAITFARNEALRLQQSTQGTPPQEPQVEPEHLLAGLLADPTTTSAQLLQAHGATLRVTTDEHSFEPGENLKLSSQSKFVLELALQVVRLQGKKSIGTEHLLWGLMRLTDTNKTFQTDLFQRYGIHLEALNHQLIEII